MHLGAGCGSGGAAAWLGLPGLPTHPPSLPASACHPPAAGKRYQEAVGALKDTFDSCQRRWGAGPSFAALDALPAELAAVTLRLQHAGRHLRSAVPPRPLPSSFPSSPLAHPALAAPRPLPSCATSCAAACCATSSAREPTSASSVCSSQLACSAAATLRLLLRCSSPGPTLSAYPMPSCPPPRRRLVDDVHGLLAAHLEETFCCFLDEQSRALEPGDAWAQVGAARLAAELWWNLDGAESPTALRLLPLLARELEPASTGCGPAGGGAPAGWLPAGLVCTWRCGLLSNHSGQGSTPRLSPLPPGPPLPLAAPRCSRCLPPCAWWRRWSGGGPAAWTTWTACWAAR